MTDELENITIRYKANLSLIFELGLYGGPITKEILLDNIEHHMRLHLDHHGCEGLTDSVSILDVLHNEKSVVETI